MHPPKVRELNYFDRKNVLGAIKVALCPYCTIPFFMDTEIEEAFIVQVPPDNLTFFIHEECYNAKLKLN
jgi:hypothetical protein